MSLFLQEKLTCNSRINSDALPMRPFRKSIRNLLPNMNFSLVIQAPHPGHSHGDLLQLAPARGLHAYPLLAFELFRMNAQSPIGAAIFAGGPDFSVRAAADAAQGLVTVDVFPHGALCLNFARVIQMRQ